MFGIDIGNVCNCPWPRMMKGNLPIQDLGKFGRSIGGEGSRDEG